eukprot:UN25364
MMNLYNLPTICSDHDILQQTLQRFCNYCRNRWKRILYFVVECTFHLRVDTLGTVPSYGHFCRSESSRGIHPWRQDLHRRFRNPCKCDQYQNIHSHIHPHHPRNVPRSRSYPLQMAHKANLPRNFLHHTLDIWLQARDTSWLPRRNLTCRSPFLLQLAHKANLPRTHRHTQDMRLLARRNEDLSRPHLP